MYMNAQLPAPFEHGGDYPSGGPHPNYQAVYRAAAPAIDFYAPDIYWPDFEHWVNWSREEGNPVFVPEARLDVAAANALYTYGEARGFGFSPFAVDSIPAEAPHPENGPGIADVYATLASMSDAILEAQQKNQIRALVLHENSWRPTQTVALGGYLFRASLSRSWPTRQLAASNGAMMVIQSAPNEFLITGSGLSVTFLRDPDTDDQTAGIAGIEQVTNSGGKWVTERVLNGDQSDQGRQLLMASHEMHVYRVRLYAYPRSAASAAQQVGH
jgi:beta-galactosidase GanA